MDKCFGAVNFPALG